MARTIGKRNITLVRKTTRKIWKENPDCYQEDVLDTLPTELWDIWEMSDQEINNIINDELLELAYCGS